MTVVAIAGGSAGLGRAIVDEIKNHDDYDVIVLTRNDDASVGDRLRCRTVVVDYTSVTALKAVLEQHAVHTVISTTNSVTSAEAELNLMQAADMSSATVRYIPSIWGSFPYQEEHAQIVPVVRMKRDIIDAVKKTSLQYTVVYNGYFLDYYGNERFKSYLFSVPVVIDMAHNTAAIPVSGDTPVAFTHSTDVARFVVASLSLTEWEEESFIIGDRVTWNEFLQLAQNAKGHNFDVVHDSIAALQQGKITELPGHKVVYDFWPKDQFQWVQANFGIWFERGLFNLQPDETLNDLFPAIRATTVKSFLTHCWGDI